MTPKPPSSSDGSALPPRHRPNMGNLAKDTTEMDLWAFDDADPLDEPPVKLAPKPAKSGIPAPRDSESDTGEKSDKPASRQDSGNGDSISVNISRKGKNLRSSKTVAGQTSSSGHSKPGSDFDDLDSWEEAGPVTAPAKVIEAMPVSRDSDPPNPAPVSQTMAVEALPSPPPPSAPEDDEDEFTPHVKDHAVPVPIRPKLDLTKIERIGLIALLLILVIGSAVFYFNTISRLPTGADRVEANDFPIKGSTVSVNSAVTFWRTPVTSGEKADTVRRDALLIPVVNFSVSGGPAAVRVFFRNSDGELVGDAVNRSVRGDMKFQIAATDGFSDMGMHAAYRTGQSKPWTIEVLEAPSEDSPTTAFKRLFEMNIASDRR